MTKTGLWYFLTWGTKNAHYAIRARHNYAGFCHRRSHICKYERLAKFNLAVAKIDRQTAKISIYTVWYRWWELCTCTWSAATRISCLWGMMKGKPLTNSPNITSILRITESIYFHVLQWQLQLWLLWLQYLREQDLKRIYQSIAALYLFKVLLLCVSV